jgi:hypothetical protein
VPIEDIKSFVVKNGWGFSIDTAHDVAFELLQKGVDSSTYPVSLVEWAKAYNLLQKNVDIPMYTISEINNMSLKEKEQLAKRLTLKTTKHIIDVLKYMRKIKYASSGGICDEINITRAIDKYGERLFYIPINALEREFGKNAFNSNYLEDMWDNLSITRRGDAIILNGIVYHALRKYNFKDAERESALSPAEYDQRYGDSYFKPNWNPAWDYTKCLLRIFQSDPRTRVDFHNMIKDEVLGI